MSAGCPASPPASSAASDSPAARPFSSDIGPPPLVPQEKWYDASGCQPSGLFTRHGALHGGHGLVPDLPLLAHLVRRSYLRKQPLLHPLPHPPASASPARAPP